MREAAAQSDPEKAFLHGLHALFVGRLGLCDFAIRKANIHFPTTRNVTVKARELLRYKYYCRLHRSAARVEHRHSFEAIDVSAPFQCPHSR